MFKIYMALKNNQLVVISLGGSLIVPKGGFDLPFLRGFKKMIAELVKKGLRFIIVCGGGQTARDYQAALKETGELKAVDIDWIGIHATRLNAHFVKSLLGKLAHLRVVKDPTKKIRWAEPALLAAGWKPGCSTDFDAVKLAVLYGATEVINLSNVDYVYDKDPNKFPDAKKIEQGSWKEFRKIVGNKWVPGANLPFDPVASKEAEKAGLKVMFVAGNDLAEARKAILGEPFRGTTIT